MNMATEAADNFVDEGIQAPSFYSSETSQSRSSHSSAKSATSSASWAYGLNSQPFGFDAKTSYDATETLLKSRSESFLLRPPPKDDDIWKRPPPDFRPQGYAPKPPKRNSREAMKPWNYGTIPGKKEVIKKPTVVHLPHILNPKTSGDSEFRTRFTDLLDPFDAKVEYVKQGMYKPGPYEMPKPHDFRGYPPIRSLGLDEFDVGYDKDPYNIHFNSSHLNIIHGLNTRPLSGSQHHGRQMAPPKTPEPSWEARLIMEKQQWPRKSASYTRFRRQGRDPHSAMMSRIDDQLTAEWAKEKMQRKLEQVSMG